MIQEKMVIHINGWNKDFGFNFDRKVVEKEHLHKPLMDSIHKNFERYSELLGVNDSALIRDSEFGVEYKIWNQISFRRYWTYAGIIFHIIFVGQLGELDPLKSIITIEEETVTEVIVL